MKLSHTLHTYTRVVARLSPVYVNQTGPDKYLRVGKSKQVFPTVLFHELSALLLACW